MRAPVPIARTMRRTAALCVAVACRGEADARESKNTAGPDVIGPSQAPGRAAWPALAVAVPAVPAIAAAARLMPASTTNRRLRMLPPREEGMPLQSGNPLVWGSASPTMPLPALLRQITDLRFLNGARKDRVARGKGKVI